MKLLPTARSLSLVVACLLASCQTTPPPPAQPNTWQVRLPRQSFLTIVIENEHGDRVRNLLAEKACPAGANVIAWDGLDDHGQPVPPGRYRWRGLYRDALHLEYQFSVYQGGASLPWLNPAIPASGWLSDHNPPWSVVAAGDKMFVGAITSEAGQDIMALDRDGKKLWGMTHPYGVGASDLAYDGRYVYAAGEAQWAGDNAHVYRIDSQTFQHELVWSHKGRLGLRGSAVRDGKLYLASDLQQKILILDLATKQITGQIPLPHPGGLAFTPDGKLLAGSGQQIVVVGTGPLITDHITHPNRLTVGPDGTIYVSDGPSSWQHDNSADGNAIYGTEDVRFLGDNQVKVFDASGKFLRSIGKPGGRQPGKYDPQALRCPIGLAVDQAGHLWVAEWDMLPKRISVWNAQSGQFVKEFLGTPLYGGGGALDPGDRTQMIYNGMLFKLDWKTGTWKLTDTIVDIMNVRCEQQHTLGGYQHWPTRILRYRGEQYFVGDGGLTEGVGGTIWKRQGAGFVACASVGPFRPSKYWQELDGEPINTNHFLYARLREQLGDKAPGNNNMIDNGVGCCVRPGHWCGHISYLMLWADQNGDGVVQPAEVNFTDQPNHWLTKPLIGSDLAVYLRKPAHWHSTFRGTTSIWRLPLNHFNEHSAPVYDIGQLEPILVDVQDDFIVADMAVDLAGRLYVLGNPIRGVDPKTKAVWTYPNRWPGMGDGAPRPEPGLLVGGWGLRGASDEFLAVNSNYGEWYLFTHDGLFVATVFGDTRTAPYWGAQFKEAKRGMDVNGVSLGQEAFFGWFGKTDDGQHYIVAGHAHCSIVKVNGLDTIRRIAGRLEVAAPPATQTATLAGSQDSSALVLRAGNQEVGRVWLSVNATNLHARYEIRDASPLQNAGTDDTLLFKTGDAVDIQLGLPGENNVRVLLTETKTGPVAVAYRYHVPGTATPVRFWSPTGETLVDRVEKLTDAKLTITRTATGYTLEATIPWTALGGKPAGKLRGDVGVLFSDPTGAVTVERVYWANKNTSVVADIPTETRIQPQTWKPLPNN